MPALSISQTVHAKLVNQLLELNKNRDKLLDDFFPLPCRERHDFAQFLDDYTQQIDTLVQNAVVQANATDTVLPFVTLDCSVQVKNLESDHIFNWNVVLPSHTRPGQGCVSCLSPVGKSLLLKQAGDTVTVSAPRGAARYQILSAFME